GKRTPRDVRYDVRGDRLVVAREIELHQSYAGEDDALRMAERHAGDFRARLFAHDRSRPFVGAESLERGMADLPVPRPLRIRDLRNERRSHPVRAAAQPSRRTARERALALLERLELASQVPRDRIGVAGAHFPRENKLAFVAAIPDEQRADAVLSPFGVGESANDELLPLDALRLHPVGVASRPIRGIAPLGNQPLESQPARLAKDPRAAAGPA